MHSSSQTPRLGRFAIVAGVALVGVVATGWALMTALRVSLATVAGPGRTSIEELITATSSAAALGLLLWVSLGLLASVVSALPSRIGVAAARVRDRVAPAAVRRGAGLLLGVAIAGSLAPGAAAAASAPTSVAVESVTEEITAAAAPRPVWSVAPVTQPIVEHVEGVEPAPSPEWTPAPVRDQPPVSLTAQRTDALERTDAQVVVRRGDTLWDLAAAHLPPGATDTEIATEWQRWYAANRTVIGPDPDLILPGQVLTVPETEDTALTGGAP